MTGPLKKSFHPSRRYVQIFGVPRPVNLVHPFS